MNNTTVVGRLTRDPVYTEAQNGKSQRVNFTIASDNRHGTGASFYDCVSFGKQADVIEKWTYKGKMVAVRGTHEQGEPYTDKNGNTRRSWTLWVEELQFIDSKKDESNKDTVETDSFKAAEDDIPF